MAAGVGCQICGERPMRLSWTDTNGVAQCFNCGTPYRLECGNPAPVIQVNDEHILLVKQYWDEFHRVIPSGFSIWYRNTECGCRTQELATQEDAQAFYDWLREQTDAEG